MKLPCDSSHIVWKTLDLADFQMIFCISMDSQLSGRYANVGENVPDSRESLTWLVHNKFAVAVNHAYFSLTANGRRLKDLIDKFKVDYHCLPYRLAYDHRNERFFLFRISLLNNEILNLVVYGRKEVVITFQRGLPSQERYEVLMELDREGCVTYYGKRWKLTNRGIFQLLACGLKERCEVSRTKEPH